MINMKITNKDNDIFESILKYNKILILNEKKFLEFYLLFYSLINEKNKEINIMIGNKVLNNKNSILFSFCDFNEIIYNLNFKKGSLMYDYLITNIYDLNLLDEDIINYDIDNILDFLTKKMNLNILYKLDIDLEKLITNFTSFKLNFDVDNLETIFNFLLENYISKNQDKIVIVFYNSNLFTFNWTKYNNCYVFDIGNNDIDSYNLILDKEIKNFSVDTIIKILEKKWPVNFENESVIQYVKKYFITIKSKNILYSDNEQEYLTYYILNKLLSSNIKIIKNNFHIHNNIKSFLEHY